MVEVCNIVFGQVVKNPSKSIYYECSVCKAHIPCDYPKQLWPAKEDMQFVLKQVNARLSEETFRCKDHFENKE
jgi:hypothetical protein